jgi:hypothetical protein
VSRPAVERCTNGNVRLVHAGRYGDETRMTMTEEEAAALAEEIRQALAAGE